MAEFSLTRTAHPTSDAARQAALADPGFGRYYVDHMVVIDYVEGDGWQDPRIIPMGDWSLHPAAAVLHYGQEIFEGMKAYRRADDSVWLFRPDRNAARFVTSAERMGMAVLPEGLFLEAVTRLVELERAWVPAGDGEQSLYLRPFMFAKEAFLGVRPAVADRLSALSGVLMLVLSPPGQQLNFDLGMVPGVFLGSFIAAWFARELKLEGFQGGHAMRRYIIGAVLMGFGGMLAGGCAVGAGISGAAIFALTAWLALIGMWLGGGLTNWLVDRPHQDPPGAREAAGTPAPQQ